MVCFSLLPSLKALEPTLTRLVSKSTTPPNGSRFGNAVAASNAYFAVGEPGNQAGVVFVYRSSDGRYLRKLQANDRVVGDWFGSALSISGNYIVVGAPDSGSEKGAAYVFDASTGRQLRKLTAADGLADTGSGYGDSFGISVSASGNMVLIGAHNHGNSGAPVKSGAAYLFNLSTGAQVAKLTASDATTYSWFGGSVSLSGNLAAVGATGADSRRGKAYLFDVKTGTQLNTFSASDGLASDEFGASIALFGNRLLVGAPWNNLGQGAAYLFDASLGTLKKRFFAGFSGCGKA